jgi:tryptophan 7-halogenase
MSGNSTFVHRVIVLGGGSAGFLAAIALKTKLPDLSVTVIRSKELGIIGVGEGSTVPLYQFIHGYLGISFKRFMQIAQPTWKLGLKFIWGTRPHFFYTFGPGLEVLAEGTLKPVGSFCDAEMDYSDNVSALMAHDRVFPRGPNGAPLFHSALSYHFENEKLVSFLEQLAAVKGVDVIEDMVQEVGRDPNGIANLRLASRGLISADLYVDCSGFRSLLLGQTLSEPFVSFKSSLFCDRAVVGGWDRAGEPVHPYTTCETMNSGWCWQIEHEKRINRGYVYCSDFINDEQAEAQFRAAAPKAGASRVVRFISGRYQRAWVDNVVAIGNAGGFVEPLEATSLGVIAMQSQMLVGALGEGDRRILPSQVRQFNRYHERTWDAIRGFLAVHYKFNDKLNTPFWSECREKTDLAAAEPIVQHYLDSGPGGFWERTLFDPVDQFRMAGYAALLVGQKVPHRETQRPNEQEMRQWESLCRRHKQLAFDAMTIPEALAVMRSPRFTWT